MIEFVAAGTVLGLSVGFSQEVARQLLRSLRRRRRRRGSNPPPPPSGPPQPLAADLIRYSRWRSEQIERALRDEPIRLDPGRVQRGNGSGSPTLPQFLSRREIPGDTP